MRYHRVTVAAAVLLAATACSQREQDRGSGDLKSFDVSEDASSPAASRAPGIVPTAAPGVAFAYNYRFRMPDAKISAAQEVHASACEKLGLDKCRITGLGYRLDGRDRVEGELDISIDPLLARGFGKAAIAEVERQEGKLTAAEITGEDQNPALDAAARREHASSSSIAGLEAELARATKEADRINLREQLRVAKAEVAGAQNDAATSQAKVDRTPMSLHYEGGGAGRGFAGENPATEAWYLFVDSLAAMVGFALKGLAVALPWLVLLALLLALFRSRLSRGLRHWWNGGKRGEPLEGMREGE